VFRYCKKMNKGTCLAKTWRLYGLLSARLVSQDDPFHYNQYGYIIDRILNELDRSLQQLADDETSELLQHFIDLKEIYLKNHPWRSIACISLSEVPQEIIKIHKTAGTNKIGYLPPIATFEIYFNVLSRCGKIQCNVDHVSVHFMFDGVIEKPIEWFGSCSELVHLISSCIDKQIIPFHRDYIKNIVCKHFCRPGGVPFNPGSCRTLKSKPPNSFVDNFIETFLTELSQQFQWRKELTP
jgi:hypothetical protein